MPFPPLYNYIRMFFLKNISLETEAINAVFKYESMTKRKKRVDTLIS